MTRDKGSSDDERSTSDNRTGVSASGRLEALRKLERLRNRLARRGVSGTDAAADIREARNERLDRL